MLWCLHFPPSTLSFFVLRLRQWSVKCAVGSSFFQFVHRPYPMVEVLMFPASGVGLEADGCWQRKGFGKQRVSNRWKAHMPPSPLSLPTVPWLTVGRFWPHPGWGWIEDYGEEWSVLKNRNGYLRPVCLEKFNVGQFRSHLIGDKWKIVAKNQPGPQELSFFFFFL